MPKNMVWRELEAEVARSTAIAGKAKSVTRKAKATKPKAKATKPKGKGKRGKDRPFAPHTYGISMTRRPESVEWGVDHALLRFCGEDDEPHPIGSRLDPEDTVGFELRDQIMAYAKANRVGNSKIRFDTKLGAWKGRADMFPPELREIAGYTIEL